VNAPAVSSRAAAFGSPLAAELLGTFTLVFAITATAVAAGQNHPVAGASFDSLAIVLVNGVTLAALAAVLGPASGGHFNPAVTVALAAIGRFAWRQVPGYVLAQLAGGVLAGLGTWAVTGNAGRTQSHLAANAPAAGISDLRALVTEALITFVLVLVVTAVVTDTRVPGSAAPVAIGFALAAAVFIGGPVTGAAVNPARALGPMIVANHYPGWWIFIIGPVVGGLAGAFAYRYLVATTPDLAGEGSVPITPVQTTAGTPQPPSPAPLTNP
jgi:MIP family channel proteins